MKKSACVGDSWPFAHRSPRLHGPLSTVRVPLCAPVHMFIHELIHRVAPDTSIAASRIQVEDVDVTIQGWPPGDAGQTR